MADPEKAEPVDVPPECPEWVQRAAWAAASMIMPPGWMNAVYWPDVRAAIVREFGSDHLRVSRQAYEGMREALRASWALSTWAATIRWGTYACNTREWLDGLRERIEAAQALIEPLLPPDETPGMRSEPAGQGGE